MLHFVTSYIRQNKSRKQTLEGAQNDLEIIFKSNVKSNGPFCVRDPGEWGEEGKNPLPLTPVK